MRVIIALVIMNAGVHAASLNNSDVCNEIVGITMRETLIIIVGGNIDFHYG